MRYYTSRRGSSDLRTGLVEIISERSTFETIGGEALYSSTC